MQNVIMAKEWIPNGRVKFTIVSPAPNPAKIATLYNGLSKDDVSPYDARVARMMNEKPWLKRPQQ